MRNELKLYPFIETVIPPKCQVLESYHSFYIQNRLKRRNRSCGTLDPGDALMIIVKAVWKVLNQKH